MHPALKLVTDNAPSGRGSSEGGRGTRPGNGHKHKPTIMVVEDEILIRLSTADFLRENGFRVLEASNASEALSVFAAGEPIELVFSDINMPGRMSGNGLADWINQQFPDVKVLLTAGEASAPQYPSTKYGPVIVKPYAHEALLAEIKRLLMA
jgi:DNA-binding NtrC family response regulator